MATRQDEVRTYSQGERSCKLESPLGDDVIVTRMSGVEGISHLFRFQVEVATHKADAAYKDLIGKAVTLSIETTDGPTRYFNGIASRIAILAGADAHDPGLTSYQLEVVPALWKLTRRSDCRVFENKSVTDILKEVFDFKGLYRLDYELPSKSYPTIEYAVQYRETDFNFVSRLMEEWGLAYAFRHEHGKHTLVIFDDSRSCPACPDIDEAICSSASGEERGLNEIDGFTCWQQMPSGKYTVNDYDFKNPSLDQNVSSAAHGLADLTDGGLEVYDFSAKNACGAADKVEQLRMEAEEAAAARAHGSSGCAAFVPGTHLKIKGHFREDLDGQYLITRVEHRVEQDTAGSGEASYENSFECLVGDIPYRPLQTTAKPVIQGAQTALVVGPEGEEIHCDEFGRIRIQFPWDRYGPGNGDKSCWARVVQSAAGKNWGAVFTPRIGQEVVVSFLEGDPDRPIVTGVVYNAEQMPPYELPANRTQSGIKTRSSKGGGADNFNEILFEDKKGSEQLSIHAEKDMSTSVENDQSVSVGNDRSVTVKKNEKVTIEEGNETFTVAKGQRETKIHANEILIVEDGDQLVTVQGKEKGAALVVNTKDRTVRVADGNYAVGASKLLSLHASQKLVADGSDLVDISSPTKVTISSVKEIVISVGNSSIKLNAQGIELSAPKISSGAVGTHEITGAMVKIN